MVQKSLMQQKVVLWVCLTLDNQRLNSTDNPFVAVEFDIYRNHWDPPLEHAGIDINSMLSVANVTWLADIKQ